MVYPLRKLIILFCISSFWPNKSEALSNEKQLINWSLTYLYNHIFTLEYLILNDWEGHHPKQNNELAMRAQLSLKSASILNQKLLTQNHALDSLNKKKLSTSNNHKGAPWKGMIFSTENQHILWTKIVKTYDTASTTYNQWAKTTKPTNLNAVEQYSYPCNQFYRDKKIDNFKKADKRSPVNSFCTVINWLRKDKAHRPKNLSRKIKELAMTFPNFIPMQTVRIIWNILQKDYALSLQSLFALNSRDHRFRLAYEKIQILYSLQERGSGRVALKGL